MEMKDEIICRETIKPSSPTPTHRRTYKLSFLDQLFASTYISTLQFYSSTTANDQVNHKSDILKASLSKTLTHFYPFAGRVKDGYTVDCNDQGVTYIEARVDCDMSIVLKEPRADLLRQLLPAYGSLEKLPEQILAVRVNHFACGGMAICVCIDHVIGDGSAIIGFLKTWADIANGSPVDNNVVCEDYTSLFPPLDVSGFWNAIENTQLHEPGVTKRFVFDGSNIDALRNEIQGNGLLYRPTRVEAIYSLIWSAVIAAATAAEEEKDEEEEALTPTIHVANIAVNLRNRMKPPLPQLSIGNMVHAATAVASTSPCGVVETNTTSLAQQIHESICKIDDTYVRQFYGGGAHLNLAKSMTAPSARARVFKFSSCCRAPIYETDFGWGKPVWFASGTMIQNYALLLDSRDGKGIEAWIGLTKREMAKFEQHPAILAYASPNPAISY